MVRGAGLPRRAATRRAQHESLEVCGGAHVIILIRALWIASTIARVIVMFRLPAVGLLGRYLEVSCKHFNGEML